MDFILTFQWTPEGRRLVTGASSGEFTLWNGLTFNFETILQVFAEHFVAKVCCLSSEGIVNSESRENDCWLQGNIVEMFSVFMPCGSTGKDTTVFQ